MGCTRYRCMVWIVVSAVMCLSDDITLLLSRRLNRLKTENGQWSELK